MTENNSAPKVIPAATVVIFRHGPAGGPPELLMVQRAKEMRFAGGAAVFPGGRIDPEDRALALRLAPDADQEIAAARVAGIRETLEETGLAVAVRNPVSAAEAAEARAMLIAEGALAPVLDRFGWEVDLDALTYFARWCPMADGAFDTCFFLIDLGTGAVDIAVDATENTRLFWASAAEALHRADTGDIHIIFPTRRNLERLAQHGTYDDARRDAEAMPVRMITPRIEFREGERWLVIPDGHGYPVLGQPKATAKRG
jgi:8-oxo-dGTP pyrophosphatase MutT (NUDIX family)